MVIPYPVTVHWHVLLDGFGWTSAKQKRRQSAIRPATSLDDLKLWGRNHDLTVLKESQISFRGVIQPFWEIIQPFRRIMRSFRGLMQPFQGIIRDSALSRDYGSLSKDYAEYCMLSAHNAVSLTAITWELTLLVEWKRKVKFRISWRKHDSHHGNHIHRRFAWSLCN